MRDLIDYNQPNDSNPPPEKVALALAALHNYVETCYSAAMRERVAARLAEIFPDHFDSNGAANTPFMCGVEVWLRGDEEPLE